MEGDLFTFVLQIVSPAAVVGAIALWRSHRLDRKNLLLEVHTQLIEPDKQLGRRLLHKYAVERRDWWSDDAAATEDRDKINAAIAQFDIVGWYIEKGYIAKDDFLDLWAVAVFRSWHRSFEPYIKVRRDREGWESWRYFERLAADAEDYLSGHGRHEALASITCEIEGGGPPAPTST